MLKRLLLSAALIAALALLVSPAAKAEPCHVIVNGKDVPLALPCPPKQGNDAGIADRVLAGVPQTARDLDQSYNCFYYVQTNVLGQPPEGIDFLNPDTPNRGDLQHQHRVPSTDYFDEGFLKSHNFRFAATSTDLRSFTSLGPAYEPEPGDIVLVPGTDDYAPNGEQFKHVGIIQGSRSGTIVRLRQKFDPYNPVVDLTLAEFLIAYKPQAVDNIPALYRIYHKPPYVGQIEVPTGRYRGRDGYLYETSQLIKVIVFWFTPDGAHLGPSPLNSRNGGLYVQAEGIFHRTVNGPLYQLLALYDAQGRARQFNQTIQLYTCGDGTAC